MALPAHVSEEVFIGFCQGNGEVGLVQLVGTVATVLSWFCHISCPPFHLNVCTHAGPISGRSHALH